MAGADSICSSRNKQYVSRCACEAMPCMADSPQYVACACHRAQRKLAHLPVGLNPFGSLSTAVKRSDHTTKAVVLASMTLYCSNRQQQDNARGLLPTWPK
jgi:hypothetical protein